MSELRQSILLGFLAKPRYVSDVAQKFGISPKLARYHMRKAVKAGQVLVIDDRFTSKNLGKKLKANPAQEYRHNSRGSSATAEINSASKVGTTRVRFLANNVSLVGMKPLTASSNAFPMEASNLKPLTLGSRSNTPRSQTSHEVPWSRKRPSYSGRRPTHLTLSSLFKELESEALALLEINRRFKVSKQSVKRLVEAGILREDWGVGGVGVRYKLSKKGELRFSAIKKASQLTSRRKAFISLESRLNV